MNLTNASKTNEVKSLARAGRYEEAAQMADRINLDRVESQHDMFVVADVYLKVGRPEDAKAVYLRLYERGKNHRVMVGLIDLCLKTKNPQQAEMFLREFRKMEPDNPERLIFRYRVDCQLGKSTEYLLKSLTKLRDEDYTDIWALELAKVYYKSGDYVACAKECKNICIWFDGTEVSRKAKVLWQSCKEKGVRLDGESYHPDEEARHSNISEENNHPANAAAMAVAEMDVPVDEMAVSADLATATPRAKLEESVFVASANTNAGEDLSIEDSSLADSIGAVVSDVMQEDAMEAAMLRYNRIMEETKQVVPEVKDPDGGVTLEFDVAAINEAIDAANAAPAEEEAPQVMSDDLSEDELAQALEEQASWALAQKIEDEDELRMAQEMAAASSQHPEAEGDYSVAWGMATAETLEKAMEAEDDLNKELSPAYIAAVNEANEPETLEEEIADTSAEKQVVEGTEAIEEQEAEAADEEQIPAATEEDFELPVIETETVESLIEELPIIESEVMKSPDEEPPIIESEAVELPVEETPGTPLYEALGVSKDMEGRIEKIVLDDDDDDDEYVITGYFEDIKDEQDATLELLEESDTTDDVTVDATRETPDVAEEVADEMTEETSDNSEALEFTMQEKTTESLVAEFEAELAADLAAFGEDEFEVVNASDEDEEFSVDEAQDAEETSDELSSTNFDDIEVTDEGPVITADYEVVEPHQMELFEDIELKLNEAQEDANREAEIADAVQAIGEEAWLPDLDGVPVDFETTKDLGDLDAQIDRKLAVRMLEEEEPEEDEQVISEAGLDELVPETAADSGMKEIFTADIPAAVSEEPAERVITAIPGFMRNFDEEESENASEPEEVESEKTIELEDNVESEVVSENDDEAEPEGEIESELEDETELVEESETAEESETIEEKFPEEKEREMAPGQAPGKTKTLDELVAAKLGAMEEEERKVREEKPLTEEQKAERAALQAMFKEDDAAIERALYDLIGGKKTE